MKTTTNYQQEAKDVLNAMNVSFKATFLKYGTHFIDDKESRDIFKCTFRRGKNSFSLIFGQSINQSTGNGGNEPTSYDVIACLQKYDVGSFENFCSEFGYDVDSRSAERVYKAVCKEFEKVDKFFTDAEIEQLQEIQ